MSAEADPGATAAAVKAGTPASGVGYRAVVTSSGRVIWSCQHVHFTEHSARSCAERHLNGQDTELMAARG